MSPEEFLEWRKKSGLTQAQAAERLGFKSFRTIGRYESGKSPIPKWLGEALDALMERKRKPANMVDAYQTPAAPAPPATPDSAKIVEHDGKRYLVGEGIGGMPTYTPLDD